MKKSIITILLIALRLICLHAQSFYYVSTLENSTTGESIIGYFDINTCKDTVLYTIQHEDFTGVNQFSDIAVGSDGFLYIDSRPAPCKLFRYDIQNQVFQYVATFPNTPLSFYISSLVCDANGMLFAAGAELFSYNIQSGIFTIHGNLPDNVVSSGDLTFYDGRLLLLAYDYNTSTKALYEINIQNPATSVNVLNLSVGGYGIFSYSLNCDSTTVYYTGDVGQLYQLDILTGGLTQVCAPPANIFGAATANEFLASDCSISLDLDRDNNSGLNGGDYTTAVCGNGPAFISDTSDTEVYSGYSLDSLSLVLDPFFANEVLNASLPLPPGVSISGQGSAHLVLYNMGAAQYIDFQTVLRGVTWQYNGVGNAPAGPHTIVATLFATGNRRDTATAVLTIQTPVTAGRDTSLTVCADAEPFPLVSLLSVEATSGGLWQPTLPGGIFDPSVQSGGAFRYIVGGGECPLDTAVINIAVQPLPIFSFNGTTALCSGDTLLLTTPLPALWQDASMSNAFPVSQAGLYWAEVTNASGCQFRDSTIVSLIPVQNTHEDVQRCFGQSYTWNGQVFLSDTSICITFSNVLGCDSTHCLTLHFLPSVAPPVINGDTTFCYGSSTLLSVSGFVSYIWSNSGVTGPDLLVMSTGLYTVTATDSNGCTTTASLSVTESTPIMTTWEAHPPGCYGTADGWIELLTIVGGTSPFSYRLDNDAAVTEPFFDHLSGGIYSIRTTGADGCFMDTTLALIEPPALTVSLGPDINVTTVNPFSLLAQVSGGQGALAYIWSPLAGLSCSDCPSPIISPSDTTVYVVSVQDENGCSASDSIRISVLPSDFIFFPNVFSPDGDGHNDYFGIFVNPDKVQSVDLLRIYDRWGNLIYETQTAPINDLNKGWDGTFNGKPLSPGVYVWQASVRLQDGTVIQKSGDVTIAF